MFKNKNRSNNIEKEIIEGMMTQKIIIIKYPTKTILITTIIILTKIILLHLLKKQAILIQVMNIIYKEIIIINKVIPEISRKIQDLL